MAGAGKGSSKGWEADVDSVSGEVGVSNDSDEEDSSSDENPNTEVGVDTDGYSKEPDEVSDHVNDKGRKGGN